MKTIKIRVKTILEMKPKYVRWAKAQCDMYIVGMGKLGFTLGYSGFGLDYDPFGLKNSTQSDLKLKPKLNKNEFNLVWFSSVRVTN